MKNWLRFEYGTYVNGITWRAEGSVYIDPEAVGAVQDISNKFPDAKGCTISLIGGIAAYPVRESSHEVIMQIQSALP